jgi:tetratricopeptide (TPR) repeat protein
MHFERAIDLAKSIGSVHWMRITTADYVRLLAREREFDRAQALLSEQFEESLPMISLGQRGLWLARAELSRACGDLDSALRVLDDLCATAKNAGDLGIRAVPYAAMLRGQVLTEIGRLDAASDDIEAALEGAHRLGIKPLEWQALAAAADHASASGDAHGAGTLSAQALEVVEQLASSIDDAALRHLYLIAEPVERLRTRVNAGAF